MQYLMYGSFVILVIAFISVLVSRHRQRHTIALHRHPDDTRRKRGSDTKLVVRDYDHGTIEIPRTSDDAHYLVDQESKGKS